MYRRLVARLPDLSSTTKAGHRRIARIVHRLIASWLQGQWRVVLRPALHAGACGRSLRRRRCRHRSLERGTLSRRQLRVAVVAAAARAIVTARIRHWRLAASRSHIVNRQPVAAVAQRTATLVSAAIDAVRAEGVVLMAFHPAATAASECRRLTRRDSKAQHADDGCSKELIHSLGLHPW